MEFGPVPLAEAEGAILAHSVAVPGGRLRKGRVLSTADVSALAAAGCRMVTVARPAPGDVHEDAAATRLAAALLGGDPAAAGLRASLATTGRVNLYAEAAGIVEVDGTRVAALNAVDPMITLATVPRWQRMGAGGMVATVKIIAYAVDEAALAAAEAVAPGALRMRSPVHATARLIETTGEEGAAGKGDAAMRGRLEALGLTMVHETVPHEATALAAALAAAQEDVLLILTASATSDIRDTAPAALVAAGGTVTRFGMPVDPGNLLFLGSLGAKPVIGLPGCARSPALNGADWVLERVVCGVDLTGDDIAAMGVGGLLKEIPQRGRPREA